MERLAAQRPSYQWAGIISRHKQEVNSMLMHKILIIEDDPSLLQLYSIALRKEGYDTFLAHNGQEAWDVIEREHIDLIMTDIMMPVMDGYEFVELLRRSNPHASGVNDHGKG